jgi:hypothetical protein
LGFYSCFFQFKGSVSQIEMGCWWYGWIEHIWRQTRTSSSF